MFAMRKKMRTTAAIALLTANVIACIPPMWQREIVPRDGESAKRAVWQAIRRQRLNFGARVQEGHLDLIPTRDTWLDGQWVVGIRNTLRPLIGGPAYWRVYLVGSTLAAGRDLRLGTRYVTTDFRSAFESRLHHRPPATEAEAFEIAKCYAWLSTHTRPERLKILSKPEDMAEVFGSLGQRNPQLAESIGAQIAPPRVQVRRVVGLKTPVFTVEFSTQSQDFWGDIYFWHMEIGKFVFSVSRRPIYLAPRVLL